MNNRTQFRLMLAIVLGLATIVGSTHQRADTGVCGGSMITLPFTDVPASNVFFCSIAEAFFAGLTNGTTPTTYSPSANVPREQLSAFVSRTLDQSVKRANQRAALDQFWINHGGTTLAKTDLGGNPTLVKSDGADLWVANAGNATVSRVRASDGKLLDTWTGAFGANGVLVAMGKVFITGVISSPNAGRLYEIDPTQPAGVVTTVTASLDVAPVGIAFDGQRIWTANNGEPLGGSVSIVTLDPVTVTNITTGFFHPGGLLFDGANIWVTDWVTDSGGRVLDKLDANGAILQSVPIGNGTNPSFPCFDGMNIWVPNSNANSITVIRAAGGLSGTVLATLTGNGLGFPEQAAFDGERILVTNVFGDSASVWKAADLTPIGTFPVAGGPYGVCSDGVNFWITLRQSGMLARF